MINKFEIGDRVVGIADGAAPYKGLTGTVIGFSADDLAIVEFDESRPVFHSGDGMCRNHHGWSCMQDNLALLDESTLQITPEMLWTDHD